MCSTVPAVVSAVTVHTAVSLSQEARRTRSPKRTLSAIPASWAVARM